MDIRTATIRAARENLWIRKRGRTEKWCFYVAAGSVYRTEENDEITLDARDCMGDDWYLIDDDGNEIT